VFLCGRERGWEFGRWVGEVWRGGLFFGVSEWKGRGGGLKVEGRGIRKERLVLLEVL